MKKALIPAIAVVLAGMLLGCSGGDKVAEKNVIQIHYTGTLADGSTFDSSEEGDPIEFMVGVGLMIPKLEEALMGMKVGEKKKIQIAAADGYGERDETAIVEVPKEQFPSDLALQAGEQYTVGTSDGTMVVTISEVKDTSVMVDFNHPLAGKDLTFDVSIVSIREPTEEELTEVLQESSVEIAPQ